MGLRSGSQGVFKHIRRLIRSFPGRADRRVTAKHSYADNRMPVGSHLQSTDRKLQRTPGDDGSALAEWFQEVVRGIR